MHEIHYESAYTETATFHSAALSFFSFFAVLLSLVLDGFDQLIKLFLHCPFADD